ncbi:hypothetical protein BKA70DRAFT_1453690 [Coprinopsis sp. MPI-PUGE-AT-0042]|nr:hypothetical protein BKA70DRAFT_1453690 [Coprinopsis sp. MPI-PUGE-AT-0042]
MPALSTQAAHQLEETSDAIDEVNVLRGRLWNEESEFDKEKDKASFRDYESACDRDKNFYKEQHEKQTVEFNIKARVNFKTQKRGRMGVWEAIELLNTIVDDSDPDTSMSQIEHLLQTAEAIRSDGKPEWMQMAGLVHDLGKLLLIFGSEGQWDVVGDTPPLTSLKLPSLHKAKSQGLESTRMSSSEVPDRHQPYRLDEDGPQDRRAAKRIKRARRPSIMFQECGGIEFHHCNITYSGRDYHRSGA